MSVTVKAVSDYIENIAKANYLVVERGNPLGFKDKYILRMSNALQASHGDRRVEFRILELCEDPDFSTSRALYINLANMLKVDPLEYKEEMSRWPSIIEASLSISDPDFFTKLHSSLDPYIKMVALLNADILIRDYIYEKLTTFNHTTKPQKRVSSVINEQDYTIELVKGKKKILLEFNTMFNARDPNLITKIEQYISELGGM